MSIGDPAFAAWLQMAGINWNGDLNEQSAMGLTAFYRCLALISGTIAGLPRRVYRDNGDGTREQVPHFLTTNPAGPYDMSAFSWTETVMLHLLLHAESYLKSIETQGGELVGLWPVHPLAVSDVSWDGADKRFKIAKVDGTHEDLITGEITQVLGMATDGLRGLSPLALFRQSLGTSKAGEVAANRTFAGGALIAGMVTSEEDIEETEAKIISDKLNAKVAGAENAGSIAFVNRSLKFSPWTMSNVDAEFLASRSFQVSEVSRIFGMPLSLLSVMGAVSNWGTGVAESFLGLQKFVLMGWTSRIESAVQAILPPDEHLEFDYAGLLQGSPADEIKLLIEQVNAGILTKDEARAIRNLPPLPAAPTTSPKEAA
jgi:HK97 family phage portal protein